MEDAFEVVNVGPTLASDLAKATARAVKRKPMASCVLDHATARASANVLRATSFLMQANGAALLSTWLQISLMVALQSARNSVRLRRKFVASASPLAFVLAPL